VCRVHSCSARHRRLHPFPTRRSSDLNTKTNPPNPASYLAQVGKPFCGRFLSFLRPDCSRCPKPKLWHSPVVVDRLRLASIFLLRSEEHTSELQSRENLVCRLLLDNKK